MYVKNLVKTTEVELEYLGLGREGKYWFPHWVKYIAWFLVVGIAVSSSVVLIFYGMDFGMMRTYLWITAVMSMFLVGIFVTSPIRILVLSLIDALLIKMKPVLIARRVDPSLLENQADPAKKEKVEATRKYNRHLYAPTPVAKLQNRLEDIKYNLELRNLVVDVISYLLFSATVLYIALQNKNEMIFHSTQAIKNLVVNASYTNSIPFGDVKTYETFLEYLNETLLPALLIDPDDFQHGMRFAQYFQTYDPATGRRTKRESGRAPADAAKKRQALDLFEKVAGDKNKSKPAIFKRGWTMDPSIKLLGIPRLRQVRVTTDRCMQILMLEPRSRNLECAGGLTLLNQETGSFTLEWEPMYPKGLSPKQKTPWIYQSFWETRTLPVSAQFFIYPGGGYVLDLARDIKDARIVLDFMDAFQWIDSRTRAVFVEFTTYCVNANLFNVVTLIAEKSATGYIIPSHEIITCKLLYIMKEVQILSVVMATLFGLLLFFLLLRESLRIHRTSPGNYFRSAFSMLDFTIVVLGLTSILFIVLRGVYVDELLERLEKVKNNEFISFTLAAFWDLGSLYIEAVLVCLAAFKVFRMLIFRVPFFRMHTVLVICYKHFFQLALQLLVLILAFTFLLYLSLFLCAHNFSTFELSFATLIGRTGTLDRTFHPCIFEQVPLASVFFVALVLFLTLVLMNFFVAVISVYFHRIRGIDSVDKYDLFRYLKHLLTRDGRSDILRLRTNSVLRLKGGGSRSSKHRGDSKQEQKKEKKEKREKELEKRKEEKREHKKRELEEKNEEKRKKEELKMEYKKKELERKMKMVLKKKKRLLEKEEERKMEEEEKRQKLKQKMKKKREKREAELEKKEEEKQANRIKELEKKERRKKEQQREERRKNREEEETMRQLEEKREHIQQQLRRKKYKKEKESEEKKKKEDKAKAKKQKKRGEQKRAEEERKKKEEKKRRKKEQARRCRSEREVSRGDARKVEFAEFLVRKPYDVTKYWDLRPDREKAMRCLTTWLLKRDERQKRAAREDALKALFLSFVSGGKALPEGVRPNYYFVVKGASREALRKRELEAMEKVVQDLATENAWVAAGKDAGEVAPDSRDNVRRLDRRLACLLKRTAQQCELRGARERIRGGFPLRIPLMGQ